MAVPRPLAVQVHKHNIVGCVHVLNWGLFCLPDGDCHLRGLVTDDLFDTLVARPESSETMECKIVWPAKI